MEKVCLHCFISGRVQGVFYRNGTQRKARELGVTGWARNLSDGRVEVFICGEKTQVEQLRDWLWEGPPTAAVEDVVVKEVAWEEHSDFKVT